LVGSGLTALLAQKRLYRDYITIFFHKVGTAESAAFLGEMKLKITHGSCK